MIASESFVSKLRADEIMVARKRRAVQVRFTSSAKYSFHQWSGMNVVCGPLAVLRLQRNFSMRGGI